MLPRRALALTLPGLLAGLGKAARAASAVWVGHDIPPYLSRGVHGPDGYAFQLFRRVIKQAQVDAVLQIYPWARAWRMLQLGHAEGALVVTRSPERETQFRWLFPVGRFRFAVFTRPALGPVAGELSALKALRIGALRASVGRGLLESAGITQVVEGKDFVELLALLEHGIVDAVIGPEPVLRAMDSRPGSEGLRITSLSQVYDLYAVAGPTMSEERVRHIVAAYQHLVDSGVVAQLRKSHPEAAFSD
ncbi:substrate-binding periplasmic protein [Roseateles sp. DXS20W]|uniref:Substrate-binding periplasmic protein n=1 Tax=Pelomonas lactea TaxID=3299030 RepID=A0ABW7GGN5_9BURK